MDSTMLLNQAQNGDIALVRGRLVYCRIASRIEGAELDRRNAENMKMGFSKEDKPLTMATIEGAQIIYANADANGNPISKTRVEEYIESKLKVSAKYPDRGFRYTGRNKSPNNLPKVGVRQPDGSAQQVYIEKDLANGLLVTFVMRVFASKSNRNHGISLDSVIVEEAIRYLEFDSLQSDMAARGIVWKPTEAPAPKAEAAPVQPVQENAPAPQPYVQQAPPQTPYGMMQQAQAPQAPIDPYAAPAAPQPNVHPYMATPNPVESAPVQNQQGIKYNPGADRQY